MLQILHQGVPIRLGLLFDSPAIRAFFDAPHAAPIPLRPRAPIHPVQLAGLLLELHKKGPKTAIPMILLTLQNGGIEETEAVAEAFREVDPEFDALSILAKGATRSFLGMRADTISPMTSGSMRFASLVIESAIAFVSFVVMWGGGGRQI